MAVVARLLTFVDLVDEGDDGPGARRMSLSARHEAVLADGRRVVLLDDRGWTEQLVASWDEEPSEEARALVERTSIWVHSTVEDVGRTARDVVGPDEPFEGLTRADMQANHWESLARGLQQQGVEVDAAELRGLPHDVELSDRVLGRIGGRPA